MSRKEVIAIWKRMSILLEAGTPLPQALELAAMQANPKVVQNFNAIKTEVESGRPLWKAMETQLKYFGSFSVSLVKIGETAGSLPESLARLSGELKKNQELKRKIISALIYPAVILVATIGIVMILLLYVFPKILPIFQAFNAQLPLSTKLLLWTYFMVSEYWLYFGVGFLGLLVWICVLLQEKRSRRLASLALLALPVPGRLIKLYLNIIFARTLVVLLKSDARLSACLKIAGDTMGNKVYKEAINSMANELLTGMKFSSLLAKRPKLFLPILVQMVSAGERSGSLQKSLLYAADILQEDLDNQARELSSLLEPALMVGMGFLVGLIALSIISPIYGITQSLHP